MRSHIRLLSEDLDTYQNILDPEQLSSGIGSEPLAL
jgi:hypothetical protein